VAPQSILDVARELVGSPAAKSAYTDDPDAFLAERGLGDLSAADLDETVSHIADAMPPEVARRLASVDESTPGPAGPEYPGAWSRLASVPETALAVSATADVVPGDDLVPGLDPGAGLDVDLPLDVPTLTIEPDLDADVDPDETGSAATGDEEAFTDQSDDQPDRLPDDHDQEDPMDRNPTGDDLGFGRGADDHADEPTVSDESDESDDTAGVPGVHDAGPIHHAPDFDDTDDVAPPVAAADPPAGRDEDPPEDDWEDIII